MKTWTLGAAAAGLVLAGLSLTPAQALSSKECGAKYQAAKTAGTLNGQNYFAYRKASCGADASAATTAPAAATPAAAPAAAPAPAPATTAAAPAPGAAMRSSRSMTRSASPASAPAATAAAAGPSGPAVFPTAVSPKYSQESAGKARMHSCLDQYNANKTGNGTGNGGLKWIQKGGGYYSECNKRLKGA